MFRKKVYVFLAIWLVSILLLPVANIWKNSEQFKEQIANKELPKLSTLYQTDLILPLIGEKAFDLGISMSPEKVILGKNNWLFLGDYYEQSISRKRDLTEADQQAIETVVANSLLWDQWLKDYGVKAYQIIIAPDKDTVYAENVPNWAKGEGITPLDFYQDQTKDNPIYIQLAPALSAAKATEEIPLYYGTDSHWNALGAAVGFAAFTEHMQTIAPELNWPDSDAITSNILSEQRGNIGGDLSRFQYAGHHIKDTVVALAYLDEHSPLVAKSNYDTGEFLGELMVDSATSTSTPMLYTNPKALNEARVLWIHDSFGDAMAPFMLESFSSVLQIHTGGVSPERLKQLVLDYKPDYVFALVVEREARRAFYLSVP